MLPVWQGRASVTSGFNSSVCGHEARLVVDMTGMLSNPSPVEKA
jgi:hypothetical protein